MDTLYVKNRNEWRAWLTCNSKNSGEIWLRHYKKDSGKPRISHKEAVEEALCFGWIDGRIKKIDEESYAQRFSPRQPASRWSTSNVKRAEKLIKEGKMTPAGLAAFRPHKTREWKSMPTELPKDLEERFRKHAGAWKNFGRFAPYYRRMTIEWVASAKKEETRAKRLSRLIDFSARNQRSRFM